MTEPHLAGRARVSTGLKSILTRDLTVDLGSSHIVLGSLRRRILLREPAIVAILETQATRIRPARRIATWIGEEARRAAAENPAVRVIRPVVGGRIAHPDALDLVLEGMLRRVRSGFDWTRFLPAITGLLRPPGLSEDDESRLRDAALRQSLPGVRLIEHTAAAAEGCGLARYEPGGRMAVEIGGGKTCVTILSMGGIVATHWTETGGQALDEALASYIARRYHLRISPFEAERAKIEIGSVYPLVEPRALEVLGVQTRSGNPHKITIDDGEARDVLIDGCEPLVQAIQQGLKSVPPEMASDILREGIILAGGGALLSGLPDFLEERTGLRFRATEDAINAIMRGAMRLVQADPDLDSGRRSAPGG